MRADSFFRMGHGHTVCQDYASAGLADGIAYAVVSDGCSGSADTDFGSRFMARAAISRLGFLSSDFWIEGTVREASEMAARCGLERTAVDATLLLATVRDGWVDVLQAGDGVVVVRRRDGSGFEYRAIEFDGGAPFYPSYLLSPTARASFDALGQKTRTRAGSVGVHGSWLEAQVGEPLALYRGSYRVSDYDMVLLLSDGADSFTTRSGVAISLVDVLNEALGFKNYEGRFVERRMRSFLDRACPQKDWRHHDDFSCAALYLDEAQ